MSKESKKFKVPDELANLYDFANSLDGRHFVHHGVPHVQGDELSGPRQLGAWMAQRGLLWTGAKITPAMFEGARQLRGRVRNYLQCDPIERHRNKDAIRSLNHALKLFPLAVQAPNHAPTPLPPPRRDPLPALS